MGTATGTALGTAFETVVVAEVEGFAFVMVMAW